MASGLQALGLRGDLMALGLKSCRQAGVSISALEFGGHFGFGFKIFV